VFDPQPAEVVEVPDGDRGEQRIEGEGQPLTPAPDARFKPLSWVTGHKAVCWPCWRDRLLSLRIAVLPVPLFQCLPPQADKAISQIVPGARPPRDFGGGFDLAYQFTDGESENTGYRPDGFNTRIDGFAFHDSFEGASPESVTAPLFYGRGL